MSSDTKMKMCLGARLSILIGVCILSAAVIGVLIWLFAAYLPAKRQHQEAIAAMQQYYDNKVRQFAAENEALGEEEIEVVFLGDSLTDGYNLDYYYPQYRTLNRGIGGDTTFGLQARLDVSVYQVQPKVAVMLIGANNLSTMMENYEEMLREMRQSLPNTRIVLLSLTSMSGSWAHNNQLAAYNNAFIRKYAAQYGCVYVDLYTPLFDTSTGEMKSSYTSDGGHLTPEGCQVLTDAITPVLAELLGH